MNGAMERLLIQSSLFVPKESDLEVTECKPCFICLQGGKHSVMNAKDDLTGSNVLG